MREHTHNGTDAVEHGQMGEDAWRSYLSRHLRQSHDWPAAPLEDVEGIHDSLHDEPQRCAICGETEADSPWEGTHKYGPTSFGSPDGAIHVFTPEE